MFSQTDIPDVIERLRHIPITYVPDSIKLKPGRLLFTAVPGPGYSLSSGLTVVVASSVSLFLGTPKSTNLSTVTFNPECALFKHQITLPAVVNIWSKNNTFNWLTDVRFLKYQSFTYGLGSLSTLSDALLLDYSFIRLKQEVLKQIVKDLHIGIGYHLDYHWNIGQEPFKGSLTDFMTYNGGAKRTMSTGPIFDFVIDQRRNINSPQPGYYIAVSYGLNLQKLGSSSNWQSLVIDVRKYLKFPRYSNNILALWSYNWLTPSGHPPYLDLPGTNRDTYGNTGRGFIAGRFTGINIVYLEGEYRFAITVDGLISGVVFVNAETTSGYPNKKFERILPAAGPGLRLKINKYSKINFAADYGIGSDGTHSFIFSLGKIF